VEVCQSRSSILAVWARRVRVLLLLLLFTSHNGLMNQGAFCLSKGVEWANEVREGDLRDAFSIVQSNELI